MKINLPRSDYMKSNREFNKRNDKGMVRDRREQRALKQDEGRDNYMRNNENVREDLIEGRNAVIEALRSGRTIENILIAKGDREGAINVITALAKEKGIVIKEVDRRKLDSMSSTGSHQGVIAQTTPIAIVK